jgi:Zn-dependent protease with chaperone function
MTVESVMNEGAFSWTSAERESFFTAIARHRRAAWRVSLVCGLCAVILALVMAVLLSPLLYCVIGLAVDLLNLFIPMPDAMAFFGHAVDRLVEGGPATAIDVIGVMALAAIPGLLLMALAGMVLRRALRTSPLFDAGAVPGRAPGRDVLAEQRVANVVEEMALAAAIPVPRVLIVPGGVNAAAYGRDQAHTTILIGEALPATLNREQMQGAVAHLIGSIADEDMKIGLRAATALALFALMARLTTALTDRGAWHSTTQLLRALMLPTAKSATHLMEQLSDPMRSEESPAGSAGARNHRGNRLTWREWAQMPLMGPVIFAGFVTGLVSAFALSPLISLAWRQRKYMADAAAVRLTRDPDALAAALAVIARSGASRQLAPWAAHLAVVGMGSSAGGSILGASVVPVFPPISAREKALAKMGAHAQPIADGAFAQLPLPMRVLLSALFGLCFVLGGVAVYLLIILSAAVSGLFLIMPAALLHALLRMLGH